MNKEGSGCEGGRIVREGIVRGGLYRWEWVSEGVEECASVWEDYEGVGVFLGRIDRVCQRRSDTDSVRVIRM